MKHWSIPLPNGKTVQVCLSAFPTRDKAVIAAGKLFGIEFLTEHKKAAVLREYYQTRLDPCVHDLCNRCGGLCSMYGKNRNGSQRYLCRACGLTFSDHPDYLVPGTNIREPKTNAVIKATLSGLSIRAVADECCLAKDTIMRIIRRYRRDLVAKDNEAIQQSVKPVLHFDDALPHRSFYTARSIVSQAGKHRRRLRKTCAECGRIRPYGRYYSELGDYFPSSCSEFSNGQGDWFCTQRHMEEFQRSIDCQARMKSELYEVKKMLKELKRAAREPEYLAALRSQKKASEQEPSSLA